MARRTNPSPLDDLDLSGEEVQRLTSAFRDPEFRRMFSEYAEELTDPENRRRYEEEITALERERGVEVRFVHPQPGHVLRTSVDGARRCFVNVCSNALVGAPSCRPASEAAVAGSQWSLPYSLAPGREYAGGGGTRYTVYDVVFHPDTLALARRHEPFRQMLDATALDAVEQQFHVKLDRRNAKTLKIKYKGTPEAAVLRSPLPGGAPPRPDGEPESPLPDFPYPYPAGAGNSAAREPRAPSLPEAAPPAAPTEPRYSVVQRHHVDLQDYRCSRDSAPSPVPKELVVTIELPLLRSAEQAALEVTGKLLSLDSRKPDYRLRLPLPYPVDDSRGKAQFNKARRQLVVTLPVAPGAARSGPALEPEEPPGTDGAPCASAGDRGAGPAGALAGDRASSPSHAAITGSSAAAGEALDSAREGRDSGERAETNTGSLEEAIPGAGVSRCPSPADPGGSVCGDPDSETGVAPLDGAMGGPDEGRGAALCPPLQCDQDGESLTLLVRVPRIQPQSLQGDLSPHRYKLGFSTEDSVAYSFLLQFAPENKLSPKEPVIDISSNNAVIELAKSPESLGHWREWYYGVDDDSLEERLFVSEDNVNEFLEEVLNSPFKQTKPLTPPLIEVLEVTDSKIQIQTKVQENKYPDQLHEKEERVNDGSHLAEKENTEFPVTLKNDSDSTFAIKVLETDGCGSAECLQKESIDGSQILSEKSQQPEPEMKPEYKQEKYAIYSEEEKNNLKGKQVTEEFDGDNLSSVPNKTRVHSIPNFDTIKETNMQDGSVQIIKDHVTNCAFSFQNSLLYDLD